MPTIVSAFNAAIARKGKDGHLSDSGDDMEAFGGGATALPCHRVASGGGQAEPAVSAGMAPRRQLVLPVRHAPRPATAPAPNCLADALEESQARGLCRRDFCNLLEGQLKSAQEALVSQHELAVDLARSHWEEMGYTKGKLAELEKEKKVLMRELHSTREELRKPGEVAHRRSLQGPGRHNRSGGEVSHTDSLATQGSAWPKEEQQPPRPQPPSAQVPTPAWSAPGMAVQEAARAEHGWVSEEDGSGRPISVLFFPPPMVQARSEENACCRVETIGAGAEEEEEDEDGACKPKKPRLRRAAGRGTQLFRLHDCWRDDLDDKEEQLRKGAITASFRKAVTRVGLRSSDTEVFTRERRRTHIQACQDGVLGPNAPLRVVWDFLSLLFVLYDVFVIPMQLLDLPKNGLLTGLAMVTRLFWTLDIPLSFNTGFMRSNGSVEMARCLIAKAYIRTWFCLDMVILCVDWFDLASQSSTGGGWTGIGKASRTFRLVRMIRLLRVVRINQRLISIMEFANSERLAIVTDIAKNMFIIIGTSHFTACVWASIDDGERSWRTKWAEAENFAPGSEFWPTYLMSFHWSLSQFAGGMDEVTPGTEIERLFAVCMLLLAFIAASIFVSSITSSMTQLTIINSQESQQLSLLKRYLKQANITKGLTTRLLTNAEHMLGEIQRHRDESKVDILRLISEPLRVELHFEIYTPHLSAHPWFRAYVEDSPNVVRRVCHKAMRMLYVSHGDSIFVAGEVPCTPAMFIVCRGEMRYEPLIGAVQKVEVGDWVSEGTLWLQSWRHMGELTAGVDSTLCMLDAEQFRSIAASFEHLSNMDPRSYALAFAELMNNMDPELITDLKMDTPDLFEAYLPPSRQSMRDTFLRMVNVKSEGGPGLKRLGTVGRFANC